MERDEDFLRKYEFNSQDEKLEGMSLMVRYSGDGMPKSVTSGQDGPGSSYNLRSGWYLSQLQYKEDRKVERNLSFVNVGRKLSKMFDSFRTAKKVMPALEYAEPFLSKNLASRHEKIHVVPVFGRNDVCRICVIRNGQTFCLSACSPGKRHKERRYRYFLNRFLKNRNHDEDEELTGRWVEDRNRDEDKELSYLEARLHEEFDNFRKKRMEKIGNPKSIENDENRPHAECSTALNTFNNLN